MRQVIFILLLLPFLSGCLTTEKAVNHLKRKGVFDDECVKAYPPIDSTSTPAVDSIKPGNNPDYTATIDSLSRELEDLSQAFAITVDSTTSEVAGAYQKQLLQAQRKLSAIKDTVAALRRDYKPCTPDTIYRTQTIYRRNTAYEQTLRDEVVALEKKLGEKEVQLAVLQGELEDMIRKRNWWQLWGGFVTWALLGLYLVVLILRLKNRLTR